MKNNLRLGVNIDHVATIRNARGGNHPDPIYAATLAANAGADSITAHLREDRRHVSENDIAKLSSGMKIPLNLEIAATEEMFIEPEKEQIDAAKSLGVPVIELHTGAYCNAIGSNQSQELNKLIRSAKYAVEIGLECHAGHGLGFNTVSSIASIQEICELNIGHFLIGESIFSGLEHAVQEMRALMDSARDKPNKETRA